jgi:hypothetical protein
VVAQGRVRWAGETEMLKGSERNMVERRKDKEIKMDK